MSVYILVFKCSQCNDGDNGLLQCECCNLWYCTKCCGISEEALAVIGEFDSLQWYCQPCDIEVSKAINTGLSSSSNTTQDRQFAIGQQIEVFQSQLTDLMTKVNEHINSCFQQLEGKLSNSFVNGENINPLLSQTSPITESVATRVIDEYRDRESRKLSIIVHKVPESVAAELSASTAHDSKWITDIVNIIGAGPVEVVTITRLGKKLDDKPRLLKVQLSNLHQKRRTLANTKKLRETSGTFQKVYVTPDLSLTERQENKCLRDELFQHKKDGKKDLIIRRGKIVKKITSAEPAPTCAPAMDTTQSAADNDKNG